MFGLSFHFEDNTPRVATAARKGSFRSFGHAAAAIAKTARAKIETSDQPSAPGEPPHTRRGQLRRAIRYAQDKARDEAVIGPLASIVGESGAAHEKGEEFHGEDFDLRPFMLPALEDNLDRFTGDMTGSLSE
jgi:hypothetical protein